MRTQADKAVAFRELHQRPGAFIIPNPWDAGTAKLLAAMGFEALATTSLGLANTLGSTTVSLDAILENCKIIAAATDLPVNADLENCGADDPKAAARAITRAAEAGCVGGSIEDFTGDPAKPIYDFQLAVERVQAAVEAARAHPFPFTLTARAENLLKGSGNQARHIVLTDPELLDLPAVRTLMKEALDRAVEPLEFLRQVFGDIVVDAEAVGLEEAAVGTGGQQVHRHVVRAVRGDGQV